MLIFATLLAFSFSIVATHHHGKNAMLLLCCYCCFCPQLLCRKFDYLSQGQRVWKGVEYFQFSQGFGVGYLGLFFERFCCVQRFLVLVKRFEVQSLFFFAVHQLLMMLMNHFALTLNKFSGFVYLFFHWLSVVVCSLYNLPPPQSSTATVTTLCIIPSTFLQGKGVLYYLNHYSVLKS